MLPDCWVAWPDPVPRLGSDVHIWWVAAPCWAGRLLQLRRLLARDERARADRFRTAADANRYIVSRSVLRVILSRVVGMRPEDIVFSCSAHGKPSVPGVEFNVAHSGDAIVIALHRSPIGVDVERLDRTLDIAAVSRMCFTDRERRAIGGAPARREAFFRLWTRKEAWLKAVGTGLSFPLREVDVSEAELPAISNATVVVRPPSRILDLPAAEGYMAACAVAGPDVRTRLWSLSVPSASSVPIR